MANYYLCPLASNIQYFDNTGNVLSNGKIFTYDAGTLNPADTFTDITGIVKNGNPIKLDAAGRLPNVSIYQLQGHAIKLVLLDKNNNTIAILDQVLGINDVAKPFDITPAEIAAGVTPTNFSYESLPIIDARRFGWADSNTSTQNATAISLAIQVLQNNGAYGGTIQLPPGIFNCDPFIIPAFVNIRGVGGNGTRLLNGDAGYFIKIGGEKTGSLKYKCGISAVSIILSNQDGHAIRLMETTGAHVRDIYSEGPITAGRTNRFLTIDGGDASSFFNHVQDCIANHYENGYLMTTTGSIVCTQTQFTNCSSLGDVHSVGANSVGLFVSGGCGNGSVWVGGNFESLGTGIHPYSNCHSVIVVGARFEDNTLDIHIESFSNPWTFIGCVNLNPAKVSNNSGTGYESQSFIGCTDSTGFPFTSLFSGRNRFRATQTGDIPIRITAYPTDTGDLFTVENSAGGVSTGADGRGVLRSSSFRALSPAQSSPPGDLSIGNGTFTTATAGSNGALPSQVNGYLQIYIGPIAYKIPFYNN